MSNVASIGKNCCGCRSCEQICPQKCIEMVYDEEGFLVPHIDEEKCTNCGVCAMKCAQISKDKVVKNEPVAVYAAKAKDDATLKKSSSGGIFSIIARKILAEGGKVFGCCMDQEFKVYHIGIESEEELYKLQGSKYVQSDTRSTYTEVRECLQKGRTVLYTGTGCQVAGLKTFLGKEYDNLVTVDVICHGAPSPLLYEKYIKWLSKKEKAPVTSFEFRNKERNGWGPNIKYKTTKREKHLKGEVDPYFSSFLNGELGRECCYSCNYANKGKVSDIMLGDYWGIQDEHPEFFDERGISVVFVNTKKGELLFHEMEKEIDFVVSTYEQAAKKNGNLLRPTVRSERFQNVYTKLNDMNEDEIFGGFLSESIRFSNKIKNLIPYNLKKNVKKCLSICRR